MESLALNNYIEQIKKYLPPWKASEIVREIRSHILDKAEARAEAKQSPLDENVIKEVIEEFGPPEKLAAGYIQPVTLIRPEYTIHFIFYSSILLVLNTLIALFGGSPGFFIGGLICIGLIFVFFVALSRFSRIYHLPLWIPVLGVWSEAWSERGQSLFHKVWDLKEKNVDATVSPAIVQENVKPAPRLSMWQRMIARSGPRPLGPAEMFGAAFKIVFGLALLAYFVFAGETFKIFSLIIEHPRDGFNLFISAPGLGNLQELAIFGCIASVASGVISLFLGISRVSLLSGVVSKIVWAVFLIGLLTQTQIFAIDFTSIDSRIQRDWLEAKPILLSLEKLFVFIILTLHLFSITGKLVRYGMLEAWHRNYAPKEEDHRLQASVNR